MAASRVRSRADPTRSLLGCSCLTASSLLALGYEQLVHLREIYLPGEPSWSGAALAVALAGGAAGLLAERSLGRPAVDPRARLVWLLVASSIAATLTPFLLFSTFPRGRWLTCTVLAMPAITCTVGGATASAAWRSFARPARQLGIAVRLASPMGALAAVIALGGAAVAAGRIGTLRTGCAIGMALAICATWTPALAGLLDGVPLALGRRTRKVGLVVFCGQSAAFAFAGLLVPLELVARYDNDIVYAIETERRSFVFTSGQDAFELVSDGRLTVSGIDGRRYYEALVHPALLAARRRRSVLLIATGSGLAEREVLRYPEVQSVVTVVVDRTVVDLARGVRWLDLESEHAMASSKVHVVEREPAVWLEQTSRLFDAILVDVQDPEDAVRGKYYTRWFYRLVSTHLAEGGVAAIQATSPIASPRTFASVVRTLRDAGLATLPYRASVPTFGDWGFVLASNAAIHRPQEAPAQTSFLTTDTLPGLFAMPRDVIATVPAETSRLDDQRVVAVFHEEIRALGL